MVTIDGSIGEGGGQILRTSLALSLVTGRPVRLLNIRAGRKKPGLLRQHLTAVEAAKAVGRAKVGGAHIGAMAMTFEPGAVASGDYSFSIGTAGSTSLVMQTVLPALLAASAPSRLVLEGGTHNMAAPPFDFLQRTFLPIVARMGPGITARLERSGYYPAGGGRVVYEIRPCAALRPLELMERGSVRRCRARAVVAGLPRHIAERELQVVKRRLGWRENDLLVETDKTAAGPGNVLTLEIESENVTELFSAFGRRGVKAEAVAEEAVKEARHYLEADVPVGRHLADQLLLPLALAASGSYRTLPLSRHAATNIEVLQKFLDVDIFVDRAEEAACVVSVRC